MVIPIVLEVHISENETSETEFSKSFGIKFIAQFPSKLQPLKVWDWIFFSSLPLTDVSYLPPSYDKIVWRNKCSFPHAGRGEMSIRFSTHQDLAISYNL